MYAVIRRYSCDPEELSELLHRIDADFLPRIEDEPGFVDYQAVALGNSGFATISMFETEQGCNASTLAAADFIRRELPDSSVERMDAFGGAVMVSRAGSRLLEPMHH